LDRVTAKKEEAHRSAPLLIGVMLKSVNRHTSCSGDWQPLAEEIIMGIAAIRGLPDESRAEDGSGFASNLSGQNNKC
jgi:hypothetical protein